MAVTGLAAAWPTIVAIALTIVSAATFILVWARDLDLLTAAVQRIEADDTVPIRPKLLVRH